MYKLSLTRTVPSPRSSDCDIDIPPNVTRESPATSAVEQQETPVVEQEEEPQQQQQQQEVGEEEECCGDDYTQNEIPFQVTFNSAMGDECSTLAEEGVEFEMLWAQMEMQQQQLRQQQQQIQQQQQMMILQQHQHQNANPFQQPYMMPPPAAAAAMPFGVHPAAAAQQQPPQQPMLPFQQAPLVRQVSQEMGGSQVQQPQHVLSENSIIHNSHRNNFNLNFTGQGDLSPEEIAAFEREFARESEEPFRLPEPSESEEAGVDVDDLQDQLEASERELELEREREQLQQLQLETWSVQDQILRESQEASQMESCYVEDWTMVTPQMNEFSERSPNTPTLYDRGLFPNQSAHFSANPYEGEDSTVPTELVPPPLPVRGPSRSQSAARAPPPPTRRAPSSSTIQAPPPPSRRGASRSRVAAAPQHSNNNNNKRAKCITATVIKPSKRTNLGMELNNTPEGAIEITRIATDGLIFVSGTPLQVGDHIIGITTSKANHTCGGGPGGMRKNDVVRLLKRTAGRITFIAQNPHGNPERVESMTVKPHPEFGTGIFFVSGSPEAKCLQIHSVPNNGLFAHSMLARGDQVLSINGVDCEQLDACVATDIVKSAPRYVSIVTKTARRQPEEGVVGDSHQLDTLQEQAPPAPPTNPNDPAEYLRTVPEERRSSFGLFRSRR